MEDQKMSYQGNEVIPKHILNLKITSYRQAHKQFAGEEKALNNQLSLQEFLRKNSLFTQDINYLGNNITLILENNVRINIMHPEAFHAQFE